MLRRIAPFFFLLAALVPARGQADTWLEVRTPDFLIVSNATEKEARRAARQFEGMRAVFQRVFPDAELNTGEPMLVLAVQDKRALQALEPESYLATGQLNLVGLFLSAPEKNYVLILLNAPGAHPYAPIYHEYGHFVFSRIHQWMPLWLSEGIAGFYQNTEILDDRVRLGKGDPYLQSVLEHNALLPLATLFAVDPHSPYYHEENKGSIFYAQSWALTHYFKDKDDLEGTHRINDYLDLLQRNVDPMAAAAQAFGDLSHLQLDLRKYVVGGEYAISEITGSTDVDDSSFTVQTLSQIQSDAFRAEFLAHEGRVSDARTLAMGILRDDSANVAARETLGYLAYREDRFDESRKWLQEAIKLDPNNFAAHYWFAAASIRKGASDKASQAAIEESLRTAIKLNPSFFPAYDALAVFFAQRSTNLVEAHDLIDKAVQLGPAVPELRVDQAQILALINKDQQAIEALNMALKMSHTPEQSAAVSNVLQSMQKLAAEKKKYHGQNNSIVLLHPGAPAGGTATQRSSATETGPKAVYAPQVEYTEEARRAKHQGVCVVSLVVGVDGKASNVQVIKKLGMGLDEKAIETVQRWKFEPGTRNGHPVPSHLTLNLKFELFGGNTEKYFDLSEKAKSGDAAAELELANAYFEGRDIPKDEKQGMVLLERAARSGLPEALFQMGERTYGDGTNADDYASAYVWYVLAQRGGATQADAKVTELESRMTPDQLSDAKKRVENWSAPTN
jgi:TonB family protein